MGRLLLKRNISLTALFLLLQLNTLRASPSIEPCPPDSSLIDGVGCKCDLELCRKPPCLSTLTITDDGTDSPGQCCPTYSCEGCSNDTMLHNQCPCAIGAILNAENKCKCVDPERALKNGKCVCDEDLCGLPQICSDNSVLIHYDSDGCCPKTQCLPCPEDSYSTNYNSDDVEDKCVCFPCENRCKANNQTMKIIQRGKGIPGSCCDMYVCEDETGQQSCVVGDKVYSEGDSWKNLESQTCKCQNGISLCSDNYRSCQTDGTIFRHGESWQQDSCTNCTCFDGEPKCIAHFCHFNESQIKRTECQPLINCNKNCSHGFKVNKRGCEICRCNSYNQDDILRKFNISKNDLIDILEDRLKSPPSTTSSSTTTTINKAPIIDKNSTTFIISTKNCDEEESAVTKGIYAFVAIFAFTIIVGGILIYKNYKRKGSYDPVKLKGADIHSYVIRTS